MSRKELSEYQIAKRWMERRQERNSCKVEITSCSNCGARYYSVLSDCPSCTNAKIRFECREKVEEIGGIK